jgi:hypothetical protein
MDCSLVINPAVVDVASEVVVAKPGTRINIFAVK